LCQKVSKPETLTQGVVPSGPRVIPVANLGEGIRSPKAWAREKTPAKCSGSVPTSSKLRTLRVSKLRAFSPIRDEENRRDATVLTVKGRYLSERPDWRPFYKRKEKFSYFLRVQLRNLIGGRGVLPSDVR